MKRFSPQLVSLWKLFQEEKKKLVIPSYQRRYSWDNEQWEEFVSSITNFIDSHDLRKEANEICFIGEIMLSKIKEEEKIDPSNQERWNLIDGQQRILTIFVFLSSVWEIAQKNISLASSQKDKIFDSIFRTIFFVDELETEEINLEKYGVDKTRLTLRNKKDSKDFKEILGEIFFQKRITTKEKQRIKEQKKVSNLLKSRKWFTEKLRSLIKEGYAISNIVATAINKLNFVEIELTEESDIIDVFISLNNTGLNLSESDLVKALLIKKIGKKNVKKAEEVEEKWEKEIISEVSSSKNAIVISREMKRFLQIFWKVEFDGKGKINNVKEVSLKPTNILQLFSYKLEKEEDEKLENIFGSLVNYAKVYGKLKSADEEYWQKNWSEKMYALIKDIRTLKFRQLDPIIVSLDINWRKKKKRSDKEKDSLVDSLEKIILYMFRAQTIKKISPGDLPHYIPDWLKWIKNEGVFAEKIEKDSIISKEFEEKETENFYEKLKNYWTEENGIHKYILQKYYFSKDEEFDEIEKNLYDDVSVEHMLAKNPSDRGQPIEDETIFSIGNTTLLRWPKNKSLGNLPWAEKKKKLSEMKKKCLLHLEDNSPLKTWPDKPTGTNIKHRAELLVNEFKLLGIFEIKKNQSVQK